MARLPLAEVCAPLRLPPEKLQAKLPSLQSGHALCCPCPGSWHSLTFRCTYRSVNSPLLNTPSSHCPSPGVICFHGPDGTPCFAYSECSLVPCLSIPGGSLNLTAEIYLCSRCLVMVPKQFLISSLPSHPPLPLPPMPPPCWV